MNVLVGGSSGFIGSVLLPALASAGHTTRRLVRRPPQAADEVAALPGAEKLDLSGFEAIVNLGGVSIASGRWTQARKQAIHDSRVAVTRLLAESAARLEPRPKVLVSASAVGYYGSRGDQVLDEESPPGDDFLARVCRDWEAAAEPARAAGVRVATLRFGVVLGAGGGALAKMAPPFRLGVGGRIGDGRQWVSWVALEDVARAILAALTDARFTGPLNVTSPSPVTNQELTRTLGRVLSRPAILPMPALAARLAFGEMADAMLLSSQRAEPRRLLALGFTWGYPTLEGALRHALGREA